MKRIALLTALLLVPATASALPSSTTARGQDGDVLALLTTSDDGIRGDINVRCAVEFTAGADGSAFAEGDTVQVRVYEDDGAFGDDLLWQVVVELTPRELELQEVSRGFDCSFALPVDGVFNETVEFYAEVTAVKDDTCFLCSYDRARTAAISVRNVDDDDAEENDGPEAATEIGSERFEGHALDEDWFTLTVDAVSELTVDVDHIPEAGQLDIAVFDADDASLGSPTVTESGVRIRLPDVEPGTYHIRIAPSVEGDHNFYDLSVGVIELDVECTPNTTEEAACGRCGTRTRLCGQDRRWTPFGPCENQGVCAPGDGRINVCGNCGSVSERCGAECAWEAAGECMDEGECPRGENEARDCDGGSEVRTCDNACLWREWGPCQGDECESGDVRACYSGPEDTATVGICTSGRQVCNLGRWGQCEGEVHPTDEVCDDSRDNDCDGDVDLADADCGLDQSALGDPCETSLACSGDLVCVGAPEHPQFVGGYCGDDDCGSDDDCDGGVCAEVFDGRFCLATCTRDPDCRGGYLCLEVRAQEAACVPRCTGDSQCGGDTPFCDDESGLCVETDDGGNNGVANNGANNGGNNGANNGGQPPASGGKSDDGCGVAPRPTSPFQLVQMIWRR